jgi:hypothetical protein
MPGRGVVSVGVAAVSGVVNVGVAAASGVDGTFDAPVTSQVENYREPDETTLTRLKNADQPEQR